MSPRPGEPPAEGSAPGPAVRRRYLLATLIVAWATGAVAFGLWDLEISRATRDHDSSWGLFVARWGELPGLLTIIAALTCLKSRSPLRAVGLALLTAAAAYVALRRVALNTGLVSYDALSQWTAQTALLGAATTIGAACQGLAWYLDRDWSAHVEAFARTTFVMALITPVAFVGLAKPLWGRVRPRELSADATSFTPWFQPQGVTGHVSFPSGHAAMGWMVLPLVLLVRPHCLPARIAVALATVAWGVFVAAGRVRIGAHYASDVLFSTGLALTVFVALKPSGPGRPSRQPEEPPR